MKPGEHPYAFTAGAHIVPLLVTEFAPAALCYPIIFMGQDKMPVAVTGVNANENLFVDAHGAYAADAYLPAYVRLEVRSAGMFARLPVNVLEAAKARSSSPTAR